MNIIDNMDCFWTITNNQLYQDKNCNPVIDINLIDFN